jgi:7-carboxy-7-deazaguanine synthase
MEIVEIFRSIQGEGPRAGIPCTFVRLAGCNQECAWCDTPHARGDGIRRPFVDIADHASGMGTRLICLTGGEPMLHPDTPDLARLLLSRGHEVEIFTNGSLDLCTLPAGVLRVLDLKTPWFRDQAPPDPIQQTPTGQPLDAPLVPGCFLAANLGQLGPEDTLKVVVRNRTEFLWAVSWFDAAHAWDRVGHVMVGPAWAMLDPGRLAEWILDSGRPLRLNLQLHKLLWGSDTRR